MELGSVLQILDADTETCAVVLTGLVRELRGRSRDSGHGANDLGSRRSKKILAVE